MKNFIYKTLMVAVMVSLILSMTSVNASAFEKEPGGYVDISGDQDEDDIFGSFSSIYSENYALINCGLLSEITFGGKTFSTNSVVLDDFLFQVNNRGFTCARRLGET